VVEGKVPVTKIVALADLAEPEPDLEFPVVIDDFKISEDPPEAVIKNLKTMHRLGILTPEAILALVGAAPIDPINLVGSLMKMMPDGWAFSAVDFTMMKILSRDDKKQVDAALRVDLIGGEAIMALARDKKGRLVEFRTLQVEPGKDNLSAVQQLCAEAIAAAKREAKG
jgi:hypothetical protein